MLRKKEEIFVFSSPSPVLDDDFHYGFLNGKIICLKRNMVIFI